MNEKYISNSQQRLLKSIRTLFDSPIDGVALGHVANRTGTSRPQALRDLHNLAAAGFAVKTENGTWAPGDALVALAVQAQTAAQRQAARLQAFQSRMDSARYL